MSTGWQCPPYHEHSTWLRALHCSNPYYDMRSAARISGACPCPTKQHKQSCLPAGKGPQLQRQLQWHQAERKCRARFSKATLAAGTSKHEAGQNQIHASESQGEGKRRRDKAEGKERRMGREEESSWTRQSLPLHFARQRSTILYSPIYSRSLPYVKIYWVTR